MADRSRSRASRQFTHLMDSLSLGPGPPPEGDAGPTRVPLVALRLPAALSDLLDGPEPPELSLRFGVDGLPDVSSNRPGIPNHACIQVC
jgi:hypothetical protein